MQNVSNYCAEQKLDYSFGFCGVHSSTLWGAQLHEGEVC